MKSASSRRNSAPDASNENGRSASWADTFDEAQVVEGCRLGDAAAQSRLYEAACHSVYRLMVRMVGQQDAADVTQQAFVQTFRKINQFSGKSRLSTWIYRIAVNEALQHLRRSKRSRIRRLEQEPVDHSPHRHETTEAKEMLEKALALLDTDLRSAFLLKEVECLSYREIADALDIPEGTVGSRLNRARKELKQHLVDLGWEP